MQLTPGYLSVCVYMYDIYIYIYVIGHAQWIAVVVPIQSPRIVSMEPPADLIAYSVPYVVKL